MIDTSFLAQLARFSLVIKQRVLSQYSGSRQSMAHGKGNIFKDHRPYTAGDDFRNIDWKVFARTDDLYIKNYEEERNLTVHIIIDTSASMNFGSTVKKIDFASMLGVGFAYLSLRENEKFQFATFAETITFFPSRRGMGQLAAMIDYLNGIRPAGVSKLAPALEQYKKFIGSRAMVILISDFLVPLEEINKALFQLGNQQVKVLQVLDPMERHFGLSGDYRLEDSETHDTLQTNVSPRLKLEYRTKLEEHLAGITQTCGNLKFSFQTLTTDMPIFDAFYETLH